MYQSETAPWLEFFAWNTDGTAKTDLVFNTAGISIVVARDNQANSSVLTLSAASGPTDWAAGKFWGMGGNKYRVGIATASISSFTGQISAEGTYTGGVLTGVTREVSAYNPAANPMASYTQPTGFLAASFPTDPADQSAVEAAITAATSPLATQASVNTIDDFLDTEIAAIKTKTDQLTFTTANKVDSTAELDPAVGTQIDNIENASGYLLAVLAGACADPQTASETYAITVFGSTFTVDMAGQTSTGTRTAPTLTKA